ncbi:DUF4174 domain-containing protein [Puniceibacterium sp. IMCC21224]|uniref:DUF4174 domain-containing protein n=1 Tax=Puniceibacterium sp. IMCC21224 TaxID=1618204 RepID=UPI00064D8D8E|nr:protein of unknown function (DUF4174) [Puniceibacterium sp. IMCC21224]
MRFISALFAVCATATPGFTAGAESDDPTKALSEEMILDAAELELAQFSWIKRPILVFADNAADPRYVQQMQFITARLNALRDRDVVVITDTNPSAGSPIRQAMHARGFMLVLIGKDGTIIARKPAPWDVREISRSIDKMPMRLQEIRDSHDAGRP